MSPFHLHSAAIATSTMKLSIRSFETKETFEIEVPSSSCTLQELKNRIFEALPSSSSTANSIHLSLNGKDELQASEEDTRQSMRIKPGDHIYFTHNPIGFLISTETHTPKSKNLDTQIAQESEKVENLDTQVVQESGMVKNLDTQVVQESGMVKNLETQLLIDLGEKSGVVLPRFTELPNELKSKILESLPGVDIARVSCVSRELRGWGLSDDLWKKKYVEQFGDGAISGKAGHWKRKFVESWKESRMGMKVINRRVAIVRGPSSITGTLDAIYTWRRL